MQLTIDEGLETSYFFKSCCDPNTTFQITGFESELTDQFYHISIPDYFSGCSEIIEFFELLPGSPTYSQSSVTLVGPFTDCLNCNQTYPCIRITATNECDIVTILPLTINCNPNINNSTITINVSGGTPPYKILWSNGFLGQTLTNATQGQTYTVTVTDYNWPNSGPDFTATTTCSLPILTPSPTPTMTPTPTPIPINSQVFCLTRYEVGESSLGVSSGSGSQGSQNTLQYTFNPTQNVVNGKFTWSSSTYTLQWGLLPIPSWQVIIDNNFFYNPNPNSPIGTYTVLGTNTTDQVIVSNGICVTPEMVLLNPIISSPICSNNPNTGSLTIQTSNAQPPVLYSIDGGITTQSNPFFNNLASGTYNIWVQDSAPTTLTTTTIIPPAPTLATYTLNINSFVTLISQNNNSIVQKLDFTIQVLNQMSQPVTTLPSGTIITLSLAHVNTFKVTNDPSRGNTIQSVSILKNNSPFIVIPSTSIQTPPPVPATICAPGVMEYTTATTRTYQNITISNNDVITGSIVTTLNRVSNFHLIPCNIQSFDKVQIVASSKSGCSCCSVTGLPQSNEMLTTFATQSLEAP